MVANSMRWPRIGFLVAGLLLISGINTRADDEKNPLREELLKLNTATTEASQNAKFQAFIKDRAKAKKAIAEAAKMLKEAKEKDEKPFNYNGSLILANAARVLREFDTAEKFYEQQIELATKLKNGKQMRQSYMGLIGLYIAAKRYNDAVETCEKVLDLPGPKEVTDAQIFIFERMILAKARQGKVDEALTLTKNLLDDTNDFWYVLQIRGQVEREAGKFGEAIKTYNEVIDKIDADKRMPAEEKNEIKDDIRYALSGLYVDNKEIDKAAKNLQTLVERHPDNPTFKNDLGFIWCDNDMNLEESEKLIREAVDLDKKKQEKEKEEGKIDEVKPNAAYLDSLGWVLFKQKKYKEALDYLKQATADEDEGNHLEIWDHLADCYVALGQKKEAVGAWEKALKMEDLSKRDGERRRKVSEKLKKTKAELNNDK